MIFVKALGVIFLPFLVFFFNGKKLKGTIALILYLIAFAYQFALFYGIFDLGLFYEIYIGAVVVFVLGILFFLLIYFWTVFENLEFLTKSE